jgi:hypothetical protein
MDSLRSMRTTVAAKADGSMTAGIQMTIDPTMRVDGMMDGLSRLTIGERVALLRQMGTKLRPWAPEAADYLESYDEG